MTSSTVTMPTSLFSSSTTGTASRLYDATWRATESPAPQPRPTAETWAAALQVKARDLDTVAGTLSGGNQQKVVLAKWLSTKPSVLIIDEPTRGIDVGTKAEVHRLLDELAGQGVAIIMISSELPEVLGMSDRVLVMHEGRVTAVLDRADADAETVMAAATGVAA